MLYVLSSTHIQAKESKIKQLNRRRRHVPYYIAENATTPKKDIITSCTILKVGIDESIS